jgi:3-methyladenine DNA glycosylase AlkD
MSSIKYIKRDLLDLADPERAKVLQRFFKTGPGQYGKGDVFLGITVPESRRIAKKYRYVELKDIEALLNSSIHEERLIALLILVQKYNADSDEERDKIVESYVNNSKRINNWDLVDLSAPNILGSYLVDKKDRSLLYRLARSQRLWERRMAIIATLSFIRNGEFRDTLKISEMLLHDKQDLIQKAVGWMLREVGKKDMAVEESFIKKHHRSMPRTMLRYAIERFPENKRRIYLKTDI